MMPCEAWYSMLGSWRLFRQIAQVSVTRFHDHTATTFHFCTLRASNIKELADQRCRMGGLGVGWASRLNRPHKPTRWPSIESAIHRKLCGLHQNALDLLPGRLGCLGIFRHRLGHWWLL